MLPPIPLVTGLLNRVQLARDYYVRVDGNDYSVDPRMIGRLVDVTATLTRVIVVCDGRTVADHERRWAKHAFVTDPAHVEVARGLRSTFNAAKRDPERALRAKPPGAGVVLRELPDYDALFGVDFDPTIGCRPSRCLTMAASCLVPMSGYEKCPAGLIRRGVDRQFDVVVVTGDAGRFSLFSVIANCAAFRSTMRLSAA